MTYKETVRKAALEREERVMKALAAGVKAERVALDEEISVARVWQILRMARERPERAGEPK